MDYEQLLEWAREQGKTEADLVRWLAMADADAYLDMTTREFVDDVLLSGGIVAYTGKTFKNHWDELEEETKQEYLSYMVDTWTRENQTKQD